MSNRFSRRASILPIRITTPPVSGFTTLMGVSSSDNDHGGLPTHKWDAVRAYQLGTAKSIAATSGCTTSVIAFTDGGGVYTGYQSTYNHFADLFEDWYYGSGSTARQNIALHIANGNEYGDKVDDTTAAVSAFAEGCRGIYEASRITNGNGTRRYPLVKCGLDPTHNQEFIMPNGSAPLSESLHAAAPYLDFVAWSMYPPGRESTSTNPTFTPPSLDVADRSDRQDGFLVRCFYRTQQASIAAGKGPNGLDIACWEIGIGDDPADNRHRPYYTARTLAWGINKLSSNFGIDCLVACWWDMQVTPGDNSQNILSDEPVGTSPSTRLAWENWKAYEPKVGGTLPSNWQSVPSAWAPPS